MVEKIKKELVPKDIIDNTLKVFGDIQGEFYKIMLGSVENMLYKNGNWFANFFYGEEGLNYIKFKTDEKGYIKELYFPSYVVCYDDKSVIFKDTDKGKPNIKERVVKHGEEMFYEVYDNEVKMFSLSFLIDSKRNIKWDEKPFCMAINVDNEWIVFKRMRECSNFYKTSKSVNFVFNYEMICEGIRKMGYSFEVPNYVRSYFDSEYFIYLNYQDLILTLNKGLTFDAMMKRFLF